MPPQDEKRPIIRIINFALKELGLFTNSKTHDAVIERFESDRSGKAIINYIVTNGEPAQKLECRQCKENLPSSAFSFYQTRVSADGYLMRSNALCSKCSKAINDDRAQVLKAEKEKIPPRPKRGAKCPNCGRTWRGNWHRHHVGDKFVAYWCGNCNMARQDNRNPNAYRA